MDCGDPLPGNTNIKVILEKRNSYDSKYTEIETLYQVNHDFNQDTGFYYNGTYTPSSVHPSGLYRLKLELTAPNSVKDPLQYRQFVYNSSGFTVNPGKIKDQEGVPVYRFIPGRTYTIPITISNVSGYNYEVKNGSYTIILKDETGAEAYHKEINGIIIKSGEVKYLSETFVFNPTKLGTYSFQYRFWDETRECPTTFTTVQYLNCNTDISIIPDKNMYNYLDTANVNVIVAGAGNYTIHFTCTKAGIDETRTVQIPEGSPSITELFQIPMARLEFASSFYDIDVEVKDNVPIIVSKNMNLAVSAPVFDYNGYFSQPFARAGSNLHFNLNIKPLSGLNVPLNGQLYVTSAQLNYNDIKSITLQPMNDNAFNYTIPISSELASDVYTFEVQFKIDEALCINEYHSILIPPAQLDFSTPDASYNAGETITSTPGNLRSPMPWTSLYYPVITN
jgi:hypothetical protein